MDAETDPRGMRRKRIRVVRRVVRGGHMRVNPRAQACAPLRVGVDGVWVGRADAVGPGTGDGGVVRKDLALDAFTAAGANAMSSFPHELRKLG
jgi:hypothetical protein